LCEGQKASRLERGEIDPSLEDFSRDRTGDSEGEGLQQIESERPEGTEKVLSERMASFFLSEDEGFSILNFEIIFEIKGLTFKISMVYDGHRFRYADFDSTQNNLTLAKEVI